MRAMKKTISVLLSVVMVLSVFTVLGITTAGAAETNTVTVTSNIGSGGDISYVPGTSEQVTVTFDFQTAKKLVAAEGVLTYDTNVLKLADSNTEATVMPNFTVGKMVNLTNPGRIKFVNTDIQSGYDFSTKSVFITVVFDIIGSGDTTVALDVMEVSVADTFPSKTAASATKIIADSASTGAATFTSENTNKVTPDVEEDLEDINKFLLYMGNFEGKVGLIHFLKKAPDGYDPATLSVKFSGPMDEFNKTMSYTSLANGSNKYYRYDYSVYSVMFAQPITIEIYQNSKLIAKNSYSIEQYILDKLPTASASLQKLYKTALNYGAYAQVRFDRYTDNLANKGIDYPLQTVNASDITVPEGVGVYSDLSALGISKLSAEMGEYLDDTRLRLFYRVTDASKLTDATVAGPTGTATASFSKGNAAGTTYQLIIPNIGSAYLDAVYTVSFTNGTTYKTTVLNGVKTKLADTTITEADRNLFSALYWYNQAANEHFGK